MSETTDLKALFRSKIAQTKSAPTGLAKAKQQQQAAVAAEPAAKRNKGGDVAVGGMAGSDSPALLLG